MLSVVLEVFQRVREGGGEIKEREGKGKEGKRREREKRVGENVGELPFKIPPPFFPSLPLAVCPLVVGFHVMCWAGCMRVSCVDRWE